MSKEKKINVARALASQLHVTEEAIDTALTEAAHLIETYVASRRAVHVSSTIGTETHHNTLKAMMALNEAQSYMSAAHAGLKEIQEQMGLGAVLIGPMDKPLALNQARAQALKLKAKRPAHMEALPLEA